MDAFARLSDYRQSLSNRRAENARQRKALEAQLRLLDQTDSSLEAEFTELETAERVLRRVLQTESSTLAIAAATISGSPELSSPAESELAQADGDPENLPEVDAEPLDEGFIGQMSTSGRLTDIVRDLLQKAYPDTMERPALQQVLKEQYGLVPTGNTVTTILGRWKQRG